MRVTFYWSGSGLDLANQLAVASAAMHTPDAEVALMTDLDPDDPSLAPLRTFSNGHVEPLRPAEVLSQDLLSVYRRTRFVQHRSDIMRFAVLAARGGVYLDTDTITRRSLTTLPDPALFFDGKIVHSGVIGLPAGHPALVDVLGELARISDADLDVYQSIVYHWTRSVLRSVPHEALSDPAVAFPVRWQEWHRVFEPGDAQLLDDRCVVVHHYGYFSRSLTAALDPAWLADNDCMFSRAALPVVERLFGSPRA